MDHPILSLQDLGPRGWSKLLALGAVGHSGQEDPGVSEVENDKYSGEENAVWRHGGLEADSMVITQAFE